MVLKAVGFVALNALVAAAALTSATPAIAVCSVFDKHPCLPTVCSVFRHRPCIPEIEYPIGQDLRLTIESASAMPVGDKQVATTGQDGADHGTGADNGTQHKLDSIRTLFDALRSCWVPPPIADSHTGMQMSVRLSFKRNGEIIGTPRVTYTTPNVSHELRDTYHDAITAALERCTPLPFTAGMGGAIAGRPIAIRFVDNRTTDQKEQP